MKTLSLFLVILVLPACSVINTRPAISQYEENVAFRQMYAPSVFYLASEKSIELKNEKNGVRALCTRDTGTAYVVDERGYLITNKHVVNALIITDKCVNALKESAKKETLLPSDYEESVAYIAQNERGAYDANLTKVFDDVDLAVLKINGSNDKFIPVQFRDGSPVVKNGMVENGFGPMLVPDEPVATMGNPHQRFFTMSRGFVGNGLFKYKRETLLSFLAPIYPGNSGGPLVSLLDYKVIGMVTMVGTINKNITELSGAIPFWIIQQKLKEIDMK